MLIFTKIVNRFMPLTIFVKKNSSTKLLIISAEKIDRKSSTRL